MSNDTIFALSSGFGRAGVAVLRVSGPAVPAILQRMLGRVPEARRATFAAFKDPLSGIVIDRGLALFFPGPASETGEDCAEFHCHGGPAIIAAMLRAFGSFEAARLAEPGEFIRRSFANGKLDLTEVEGLGDLIEAETEAQRRQALRQAGGGLRRKAEGWRKTLLESSALVEAEIDFGEEADIAATGREEISKILASLAAELRLELAAGQAGERLRQGLTVVIAGPPNAGKSTLLNALARRDVAIVSTIPGTTRDSIEVHLDLQGLPLTLIDTAGLRPSADPIEKIGMERTRARAAEADLVLWLSELCQPEEPSGFAEGAEIWRIFTKADLLRDEEEKKERAGEGVAVSAATGENMERLLKRLEEHAHVAMGCGERALLTRERHRRAIAAALAALERALAAPLAQSAELLAEDLRCAIRALESLIGKVDIEDVLGEIFARFCIGK